MGANEEIKIRKVHTFLDLAVAAIVFAAGVGIYFLLPGWGILFCLIGILLFLFYKRAYKCVGERTVLNEKSQDVALECSNGIIHFLDEKADKLDLPAATEGDHLYLEAYFNAEKQLAYARLYDVAENRFEPVTEMKQLRGSRAQTLITELGKNGR